MRPGHIAFCVDHAYGHINPTLGIASELLRRGHTASYAVSGSFADVIRKVGARPVVFEPVDYRSAVYPLALQKDGSYDLSRHNSSLSAVVNDIMTKRTQSSFEQLQALYTTHKPDLIIHDDGWDLAGRQLADHWAIPRIRFVPVILPPRSTQAFANDQVILVGGPRFLFGEAAETYDERFNFLGFVPESDDGESWKNPWDPEKVVLVSPTTGLLPQVEFCSAVAQALQDVPVRVVLSAAGRFDVTSCVNTDKLAHSEKLHLNESTPNRKILKHACLYIGQGGPRSVLEAFYHGVPVLLIPPSQAHDHTACRVTALGLGIRLSHSQASPENIRRAAQLLLRDQQTLERVNQAAASMREGSGAIFAADVIEGVLARK
jgi:UDP:flavonoid glycosyltransferase YjiC (YdhE family)